MAASSEVARRFDVLEKIGTGQSATVSRVRSKEDGKQYVLKEMGLDWNDRNVIQHAMGEIGVMVNLPPHPNIVQLKESFIEVQGPRHCLCLVIEWAEAGDLHTCVEDQRKEGVYFEEDVVLDWLVQLASSLHHLHSRKILHRDLKLHNVFLDKNLDIKLGDFGFSMVPVGERDMTVLGTPYFASPELLQRVGYGEPNDVWAIGVIGYCLCALDRPFEAKSFLKLARKIINEEPTPLPSFYSEGLKGLILSMLAKDPNVRPSAGEILDSPVLASRATALAKAKTPVPTEPETMCTCYLEADRCSCGRENVRGKAGAFPVLCQRFRELKPKDAPPGTPVALQKPVGAPYKPGVSVVPTPTAAGGKGPKGDDYDPDMFFDPGDVEDDEEEPPATNFDNFSDDTRSGLFRRGLKELRERYNSEITGK